MNKNITNNLNEKYSKGTIIIHWVTLLLILFLFPQGKYLSDLTFPDKLPFVKIHVIIGLVVFILTLIRTYLYFKTPQPSHIKTGSKFNDILIILIHKGFYFVLFGLAITGIGTLIAGGYFQAFTTSNTDNILPREEIVPLEGHELMALLMVILFILHTLGVIKHYITKKENTLKRII